MVQIGEHGIIQTIESYELAPEIEREIITLLDFKEKREEYQTDDIVVDNEGNEYEVDVIGSLGLLLTEKSGRGIEITYSIAEQIGLRKK